MILRIIATTILIFCATLFYNGLVSKSKWLNGLVAVILAAENAAIFSILRFLATPLIWVIFGLVGLILNIVIMVFMDKLLPGITFKKYAGIGIFALFVSVLSGIIYWVI